MKSRTVIAIDGLAGSGKTTLARELARKMGYRHLNSGLLYRAVGYLALELGVPLEQGSALAALPIHHQIVLEAAGPLGTRLVIDGKEVTEEISTPLISEAASKVAAHATLRTALYRAQKDAFIGEPLVAEGRDMGTVVFPDAALKFFIETSIDRRISRRLQQLGERAGGREELVRQEILERDKRDSERSVAPTVAAQDAVLIDNSFDSLTVVVKRMYDTALSRGLKPLI